MNDHIIICGFGATGRSAAADLRSRGRDADSIVVVDIDPAVVADANARGYVGVAGDATSTTVLREAMIDRAAGVIVAPNRDDTAVLVTLTARELNPTATIIAAGRERENLHLLRQGGADQVIDATSAVGRMLGFAMESPGAVRVLDDLIDARSGLELVECGPEDLDNGSTLVAIERDGRRLPPNEVSPGQVQPGDRLVIVRETQVQSADTDRERGLSAHQWQAVCGRVLDVVDEYDAPIVQGSAVPETVNYRCFEASGTTPPNRPLGGR